MQKALSKPEGVYSGGRLVRFIFLAIFFISYSNAFSEPCRLNLVSPKKSALVIPVEAGLRVNGNELIVQFDVHTPTVNAKPELGPGEFPYMFDAVEIFVTASETNFPYYEYELSPYNQTFQVAILDLKKPFLENANLGLKSSVTKTEEGWQGEMHIPLPAGTDPKKLRGNLYAILGKKPNRSYWSAFLPPQAKPNFHQPQFFAPLEKCEVQP